MIRRSIDHVDINADDTDECVFWALEAHGEVFDEVLLLRSQAAELAEYSAKITLLEEAKRSKEEEAESWHSKVSFQNRPKTTEDTFPPEMRITLQERMKPWKDVTFTFLGTGVTSVFTFKI